MNQHPYKRILLATEHTDFDAGAERLAFEMAKHCGMPLRVIIPVLSNAEFESSAPELAQKADEAVASKIAALEALAAQAEVKLDVRVRHGAQANQEIVEEAHASGTDLIIIRRRGQPGMLANLLVGEMVSKVIRDAKCDVLMVPRMATFWQRHILAAVGEGSAAVNVAEMAGAVAGRCGLPLTLLSVAPNEQALEVTQRLNTLKLARARALCPQAHGQVLIGNPVEQTIAVATDIAADLLIVGKHRHNFIPFISGEGTIMQRIAGALVVPTLVVQH